MAEAAGVDINEIKSLNSAVLCLIISHFLGSPGKANPSGAIRFFQELIRHAFNSSLSELTNDELRAKTAEFKQRIAERTNTFSDQIIALEKEAKEEKSAVENRLK